MRQLAVRVIPPRFHPLARRVYAHGHRLVHTLARAGALTVLIVATVVATAIGSRPVAMVALVAGLTIGGLEWWRMYGEHRRLRRALASLVAGRDADSLLEVPAEWVPVVVQALLDHDDVLDAYALLSRQPSLAVVDLTTRLRLRDALYARGYLSSATAVAQSCAASPWGWVHRRRLRRLEAEYRVLSGEAELPRVDAPATFSPVSGRVLHIVGTSLPTTQAGFTIRTHYIAVAQAAAGMVPHVVTQVGYGVHGSTNTQTVIDGVTYHRLAGPSRSAIPLDEWLAENIRGVAAVVERTQPAVLHAASDYLNALTARAVGDAFGLPVVYESRGFWEETLLSRLAHRFGWDLDRLAAMHGLPDVYVLRRDMEDRCRRAADRVVTLSESMADRIEAGGVDQARISVVPNAIEIEAFPVQQRNHALATRLGIADATTVIGYISSLVEYEGIDILIDAYVSLRAAGRSQLALLIVGDGDDRDRLARRAADLSVPDVIFTGRVAHDQILGYYSLIDIFVVPRKPVEVCHLVTPLKPFEAFATGRTVVMSDVRALTAIAKESGAAELFSAGSAQSLAETLSSLLDDGSRRRELAETGAAWVRANRTWSANAERYARLYAELGGAATPLPTPER